MPALIFRRSPWDQDKPPLGARINWSHPLAANLRGCWLFNEGGGDARNLVTFGQNNGALSGGCARATSQRGRGISCNGTSGAINVGRGAWLDTLDPLSFEALFYLAGAGENSLGALFWKTNGSSDGSAAYHVSSELELYRDRASTDQVYRTSGSAFATGKWYHVLLSSYALGGVGDVNIFINGAQPSSFSSTTNGSGAFVDESTGDLYIGNRPADDWTFNGTFIFVRVYNRFFDDAAEVRELFAHPYAMFAPPARRLWFSSAADILLTPAAASAIASSVAPTVVHGSLSIAPGEVGVIAATVDPAVVSGDVTLTPAALNAIARSVDPGVIMGDTSVSPAAIHAIAGSVDPAVVAGDVTLTPEAIHALAGAINPVVIHGPIILTPDAVSAIARSIDPDVVIPILITPTAVWAVARTSDPTVSGTFEVFVLLTLDPRDTTLTLQPNRPVTLRLKARGAA